MKEILNYTGKRICIKNESGQPFKSLPSHGNARYEATPGKYLYSGTERTPIVKGLPSPDLNLEKMYIVPEEVAAAFGNTRKDLLIPKDPIIYEGSMFYTLNRIS